MSVPEPPAPPPPSSLVIHSRSLVDLAVRLTSNAGMNDARKVLLLPSFARQWFRRSPRICATGFPTTEAVVTAILVNIGRQNGGQLDFANEPSHLLEVLRRGQRLVPL